MLTLKLGEEIIRETKPHAASFLGSPNFWAGILIFLFGVFWEFGANNIFVNYVLIVIGFSLIGFSYIRRVAGYKFYEGSLEVVYQAPYMETWDAALRALDRMNIKVTQKEHDFTAGKIDAMRADEKEVRISVEYKSAKETEVSIRVGVFGDERASDAIKEEIRKELFET